MLFLQSKDFSCCLIRPTSSLQSKFPFSSSINSMKDTLIPKKLTKPIKKTTTATSIIKRKFKTTATVNPRANPSSTIPESDFRDDDDDNDLNPSSSLSTFFEKWPILSPDFYQIDALDLAPLLLGKYLRRDDVVLQITEVEAYRPNDSACHGRFGMTARTAPVVSDLIPYKDCAITIIPGRFGPGGHAYVYLCYGLHTMLNIVADREGAGAAVLIRSCAPISGLKTIQQRRGIVTEKPVLLTGPGKVGQALGISTDWSNHSLYTPGGLELLDGPRPEHVLVGPRVGIDYALPEHVNALWRFAIAGTPWISAPKNTLRPP